MGGTIWFESKLEEGTSFFFTVTAHKGKTDTKEDFSDFNGKTALVIEENGLFKDVSLLIYNPVTSRLYQLL